MEPPIADLAVKARTGALKGKRVALAITGGIAAVESVKLIRELRRHGARVTPFATPAALRFITPLALEWASQVPTVIEEGPQVDYLDLFDLVVVAPATLNTLVKAACGICDNVVLLLLACQIARKAPLLVVPTMNEVMALHPKYEEALVTLKSWGARFLVRSLEEERIKITEAKELVAWILAQVAG